MPKQPTDPIAIGDVFYPKIYASSHFWVVTYYDTTHGREALIVYNFTSCCPEWKDNTCVVTPGEYSELTRDSAIAYQHGRLIVAPYIATVVTSGIRRYLDAVSSDLLLRIQRGALTSKFTQTGHKDLIRTVPGVL
jgi:hypothetical protein